MSATVTCIEEARLWHFLWLWRQWVNAPLQHTLAKPHAGDSKHLIQKTWPGLYGLCFPYCAVSIFQVPVLQRGGTVVTRRTGCGSCTDDLQQYPFTLTVALDLEVIILLSNILIYSWVICLHTFTLSLGKRGNVVWKRFFSPNFSSIYSSANSNPPALPITWQLSRIIEKKLTKQFLFSHSKREISIYFYWDSFYIFPINILIYTTDHFCFFVCTCDYKPFVKPNTLNVLLYRKFLFHFVLRLWKLSFCFMLNIWIKTITCDFFSMLISTCITGQCWRSAVWGWWTLLQL